MMANLAQNHYFNPLMVVSGRLYPKLLYVAPAGRVVASSAKNKITSSVTSTELVHDEWFSVKRYPNGHHITPDWDFNHHAPSSLHHKDEGEEDKKRIEVLKGKVKKMVEQEVNLLGQLVLIDTLEGLGISYHFQEQIHSVLRRIYSRNRTDRMMPNQQDLYATALEFRLLRQHGFPVSPDIFDAFKDENGAFKPSLAKDPKGMLYLYEASYLETQNDGTKLEMAREFTEKYLKRKLDENGFDDEALEELARHSLELPFYHRMVRVEARWYIDLYDKCPEMNPILLELAKLDFNFLQKSHIDEIKSVSRWWKNTGMKEILKFERDILVEDFFWCVGVIPNVERGFCRTMEAKVSVLTTMLDEIYDSKGSLDELELFTSAVERWDINSIDQLPYYMKICFHELHNLIYQSAYEALRDQGVNTIPYLTKIWAGTCKAYLQEAKWYHSGYVPKFQEYLDNAYISITVPMLLLHVYISVGEPIQIEALEYFCRRDNNNVVRPASTILRLANDLADRKSNSLVKKRGDVAIAIECYMKEKNVSEERAREYMQVLIKEAYKELNMARFSGGSPLSSKFVGIAIDLMRSSQYIYKYGDGHDSRHFEVANHIAARLFKPIPIA